MPGPENSQDQVEINKKTDVKEAKVVYKPIHLDIKKNNDAKNADKNLDKALQDLDKPEKEKKVTEKINENIDEKTIKTINKMIEKIKNNNLTDLSDAYFNQIRGQEFTINNGNIGEVIFRMVNMPEYVDGVRINKIGKIQIIQKKDGLERIITIEKGVLSEVYEFSFTPKKGFKKTTQEEFMGMKKIMLNARPNYDPKGDCFYNDEINSNDRDNMLNEINKELDKQIK